MEKEPKHDKILGGEDLSDEEMPDDIEGLEDDPELLEIKKEIEAEKAKIAGHKREDTVDLEKRLESQLAALETNAPEQKTEGKSLLEEDPDLLNLYKDIDAKYKEEMDELWSKYVEDPIVPEEEKIARPSDFSEVHNAILNNPFLRKMIKPEEQHGKEPTLMRFISKEDYKLPKCLIYDLLLRKYNIHSAVVPDYTLKKVLIEYEPNLKSKDVKKAVESNIVCARVHFLTANYNESENRLKEVLKLQPKNKEAIYWLGLVYFYSYRAEATDKAKAEKAKQAQLLLLEVLATRLKDPNKDSSDVMLLWSLLVLTLELQTKYAHLKIKPKNKAEAYSFEIKRIDEYLGYIAWTEKYSYSGNSTQITDCNDILRELITKYPNRPEAYLKLWRILYESSKTEEAIDISEQLFIEGTEYDENELMSVIVLTYVKSLIKGKHDLMAFQKLQYQYTIQTDIPMFLYHYGKYIAQGQNESLRKHFLGSALSSLQECIRSCLPFRHAKVYYWMGKIYEQRKDIVNAMFCYGRAVQGIKKGSPKFKTIAKYMEMHKEFQTKY